MQLRRNKAQQGWNRGKRVGLTMIEVMFAVFILTLMALMIAAIVPISIRANKGANNYQQAMQIAQRKLDQLQDSQVGFDRLRCTDLETLEIVDDGCTETGTFPRSDYRLNASFVTTDKIADDTSVTPTIYGILGSGSTATITIQPWTDSLKLYNGNTEGFLMKATVTFTWRIYSRGNAANTSLSTYTLSTLITRTSMD